MYKLAVIEESLEHNEVLDVLKPYFFSQRIENVPEDEYPVWHTNEYHIADSNIENICETLKDEVKLTWYIHAFNDKHLFVILKGKCFELSLKRDDTWNEMIEYGAKICKVERSYLETVPLHV